MESEEFVNGWLWRLGSHDFSVFIPSLCCCESVTKGGRCHRSVIITCNELCRWMLVNIAMIKLCVFSQVKQ